MTGMRQVELFMRYLRYEKRYSPHTLVAYEGDIRQFYIYLRDQYQLNEWAEVGISHVRSWVYGMADQKLDKNSINRKISTLRSFCQFLKKEDIVKINPVAAIQPLKTAKQLPEVIPEETLKNFFIFAEDLTWHNFRDKILIMLLYETGMRRSELKELKWKNIDLNAGNITVMGKRQKQRQIPIRDELVDMLKSFKNRTAREFDILSENVMITDKGTKVYPKWIYNKVKMILGSWSNSENVSPHILRHSIATHLLNAGADIQIIREFLGHSSLAATEIYTHNSIGKLKKTYKMALPDLDSHETIQ